ncbi:MAG: TonB-dependent receptor [Pseudomonadota bacterium]
MSFKSVSKIAMIASAACLSLPVGQAQESADESEARLPTVTTTAQRREQNIQDVPIAVSSFSPAELEAKQITEPLDLIQYVPNLYGGNNTGLGSANMYYIRGLGNTESIATFDPPVGTYVDEVYIARQNANNTAFFDVEQIEVLRGPQGTLFGRNTTGGAVSIRMAKPSETFGGFIEGELGSFDRYMVRGSVDVPVSETVLTKLSGFWLEEEGYVDNLATGETLNGQDAYGLRGDLRIFLSDTMTWDLAADVTEDEGTNILNYDRDGSPLGSTIPGGETEDGQDRVANTGLSTSGGSGSQLDQLLAGQGLGVENNSYSITSNFAWETSENSQLNFILGWRSLEQDFVLDFFDGGLGGEQFSTGGFAIANEGEHDQFSAELKYDVSLFDGAVDLVSGVYYFSEDNTTDFADVFTINLGAPTAIIPFPLLLADRVLENDLTSTAAYAQADWSPAPNWTITVGARWTEETKEIEYSDNRDPATVADPNLLLTSANIAASGAVPLEQTKALITPRVAVEYDFNEDVSAFISYTEGFKSGGWNARETFPSTILPFAREIAKTTEIGFRSILFDDSLRFNATAFFLEAEDLQSPSAFVRPNGSIGFLTQNFSDFENTGLEIDLNWAPTDALTIDASLGLQDAEYTNPGAPIVQQQADCAASPTNAGGGQGIVAPDCSLSEPVRVPDTTLSLGGTYRIDLAGIGTLTPAANVRYVSETFTGTSNLPNSLEDGYTLVNLGATLDFDNANWKVIFECKNCTDEAYVTSNLPPTAYFNDPRRIGLRIRYDF